MSLQQPSDLGRIIRERRKALLLGQQALADLAGVSRQWVLEFEKGKPRAEVGLVLRILEVLGLELSLGVSAPDGGTHSLRAGGSERRAYEDELASRITIDPGKRSGKPCIRGLRITVYDLLEYLAAGMSEDENLADFPELMRGDVRACLVFAADRERRLMNRPA